MYSRSRPGGLLLPNPGIVWMSTQTLNCDDAKTPISDSDSQRILSKGLLDYRFVIILFTTVPDIKTYSLDCAFGAYRCDGRISIPEGHDCEWNVGVFNSS